MFACTGMVWALDAPAGEWVVQTAAGSVVGRAFSAISRLRGVKVIEIVRRPEQKKELLNAGCKLRPQLSCFYWPPFSIAVPVLMRWNTAKFVREISSPSV